MLIACNDERIIYVIECAVRKYGKIIVYADRSNFYFLTRVFHSTACQLLCTLIVPNTFLRSIYFLLAQRLQICIIFIWSFTEPSLAEQKRSLIFLSFSSSSMPCACLGKLYRYAVISTCFPVSRAACQRDYR